MEHDPHAQDNRRVRRHRGRGDLGQAALLTVVAVAVVAGVIVALLAGLGAVARDRARARTAADAAALAGAGAGPGSGPAAAMTVAAANGGELEHQETIGEQVEVTVRVGAARATARAVRGRAP